MPGLPSTVVYVRTLVSANCERTGGGRVPRSRNPVTANGVTAIHASPSQGSIGRAGGATPAGTSDRTGQGAERRTRPLSPRWQRGSGRGGRGGGPPGGRAGRGGAP